MDSSADDKQYVECPVCGTKMSYSEKLYVIPFYTLDDAAKSFSVVAKGVCWECFRGRVMHGDDYRPDGRVDDGPRKGAQC
jgi:C4-type Zn-finger protein